MAEVLAVVLAVVLARRPIRPAKTRLRPNSKERHGLRRSRRTLRRPLAWPTPSQTAETLSARRHNRQELLCMDGVEFWPGGMIPAPGNGSAISCRCSPLIALRAIACGGSAAATVAATRSRLRPGRPRIGKGGPVRTRPWCRWILVKATLRDGAGGATSKRPSPAAVLSPVRGPDPCRSCRGQVPSGRSASRSRGSSRVGR